MLVTCSSCEHEIRVPDAAAGKRAKCPFCGTVLTIPAADDDLAVESPAGFSKDRSAKQRGSVYTSLEAEMKFAWVPPGMFLMGGNGTNDNPLHRVTITKGFWMGIYPVTQAQWHAVMGYNPSNFRGDDRPVEMVSWDDCKEFCEKFSQLVGKTICLPTEAEWEYACRAGTTSEYFCGNGEEALKKVGWHATNSGNQSHIVGEKKAPNAWGLFDVHGNVWEWCEDWYGPLESENQTDPVGPSTGGARVARGGSWKYPAADSRAACRSWGEPRSRYIDTGLRVCFRPDSISHD